MDDNATFVVGGDRRGRRQHKDDSVLKREGMFTEKIAAIVGPTYVSCFFMGAMVGLTKIPPPKSRRTTRLLVNNYLNNIGKSSAHFANSAAAGVLLYLTTGKMIQYVF